MAQLAPLVPNVDCEIGSAMRVVQSSPDLISGAICLTCRRESCQMLICPTAKAHSSMAELSSFLTMPPAELAESDVSSVGEEMYDELDVPPSSSHEVAEDFAIQKMTNVDIATPQRICTPIMREPLQWKFKGLTLWLELEEFNQDLTNVIRKFANESGLRPIPQSHITAIYGMEHLSPNEALSKLKQVPQVLGSSWPAFRRPVGVVQDIAVAGRPGQVCTISWAELTFSSSADHEVALDKLYELYYPEPECRPVRDRPWKPHNSIAYDNPDGTVLTLAGAVSCISTHPTILHNDRRVAAVSLWDTNGKMEDWNCLGRVKFG